MTARRYRKIGRQRFGSWGKVGDHAIMMASARTDAEADPGWLQLVEFLAVAGLADGVLERNLDLLAVRRRTL